jgi:hypothetical protein
MKYLDFHIHHSFSIVFVYFKLCILNHKIIFNLKMAFRDGGPLQLPMICTFTLMVLTCTTLIHVNLYSTSRSELAVRDSEARRSKTYKLTQPSTWYIPGNPKVNSMGFEWADAQRQSPTSVYTSSTNDAPADIIYQSPTYSYIENGHANDPASDTMYQSIGTTQSYNSQPASNDYIPQYTRIWNSPEPTTASDFIPQMIGNVVNARGRAGPAPAGPARRLSTRARTQALLNIFDEPSTAHLDAIQKELDNLKDPAQRRRHHAVHTAAGTMRFAAVGGPLRAMMDRRRNLRAWQWHTAGPSPPRAPTALPRSHAPCRHPR